MTLYQRNKSIVRVGVCVVIALQATVAVAQSGFRVETDIFQQGIEKPLTQTLSLFADGVAYDFSRDETQDITMVEPAQDRITRFNQATQLRTEIKISTLEGLVPAARTQARMGKLAIFLAGSDHVELGEKQVVVGELPLRYEASFQAPDDSELAMAYARLYRQFADASKLLNSFSTGGDPPFARLTLNRVLAEQGVLPREISVHAERGGHEVVYLCRLHANWSLTKPDLQRIDEIKQMLSNFKLVDPTEFNRLTSAAKVASAQATSSR